MSRLRRNVEALAIGRKKPRDYDPEDDQAEDEDEPGTSSEEEVTTGGREHYERVGKSALRKPEVVPLDAKYGAAAVSRAALAGEESEDEDPLTPQDEDEDPFAVAGDINDDNSDNEAEEDESHSEEDLDVESDGVEDSMNGLDASGEDGESDEEMDDVGSSDEQEETEDETAIPRLLSSTATTKGREELKMQIRASQNLAASLSKAASDDAKKGQAVRKQYQTFDSLLDARMKLQKGLTTSEDLRMQQDGNYFTADAEDALQQAQDAALRLFNTIGSFRDSIAVAAKSESTSKKRKRSAMFESVDDLGSIWASLTELEAESLPARQTTIDRWSTKAKISDPSRAATSKAKFLDSSVHDDRLTTVLDTFIISEQEKFFRTRNAQVQGDGDAEPAHSLPAYDDSMFYQSLLRDLITARSAASTNDISTSILPSKLHVSGNRQSKKTIDTKASKGRKIRYTVHEKLQNFMASEGDTGRDTAMWTERGKNEFFGSLFGQDRVLREDDKGEDVVDGNDVDDDGGEVEALRFFRT